MFYKLTCKVMRCLTEVWIFISIKHLVVPNLSFVSGHTWAVSENNFQHSYHLILEEYRNPLIGSPREDPFHFPLTFCRQRSNMETDASLSILRACPTISNKPFLLECHMKGHLHLRMEELLQPVDTLGDD